MKSTRGLMGNRVGSLTRERHTGLIALGIMIMTLATLVIYQRLTTEPRTAPEPPMVNQPIEAGAPVQGTTPPPETMSTEVKEPLTRLVRPLGSNWQVIKEYGSIDEAFGDFRLFSGLALAVAPTTSVLAGGPGRVVEVEQDPLDGGAVVIDHGAGLQIRYAGLGQILVQLEQEVDTGQELGQIASAGTGVRQSLGSHLYLQVFMDGDSMNPIVYFPN